MSADREVAIRQLESVLGAFQQARAELSYDADLDLGDAVRLVTWVPRRSIGSRPAGANELSTTTAEVVKGKSILVLADFR